MEAQSKRKEPSVAEEVVATVLLNEFVLQGPLEGHGIVH